MANPFYVQPGNDFGQGIQALTQGIDRFGQQKRQDAAVAKQEAYGAEAKQALGEAFKTGDPVKIRDVMVKYPEMQKAATAAFGFANEQTRQTVAETYRRALSDPERAAQYMDEGIQKVAALGGSPDNMLKDYSMLKVAPDQALKSMKAGYAALANEQEFSAMFGGEGDLKVGRFRQITLPDGGIATLDTATNEVTPVAAAAQVDLSILPPELQGPASKQPPEVQRKIVESFTTPTVAAAGKEAEKKAGKAQEVADKTSALVNELLENESGLRAVVGGIDEMTPTLLPSSKNAQAALEDLKNLLTVDNLGLMSGVLSESDMKVLRSVGASGLSGSQDRILGTLKRMREALSKIKKEDQGVDDLVNKYAD